MPVIRISNGIIEDIFSKQGTTYVTVTYRDNSGTRGREQTVRLVIGPRTVILNTNGFPIPASLLRVGSVIDATISSAMTRSIPPQSAALYIRIVRRSQPDSMTIGTILSIDETNRSFVTISNRGFSDTIRFNVPENVRIYNRLGRSMDFSNLRSGMRVRVRHANFMTASIPPQTTAFEIRVL